MVYLKQFHQQAYRQESASPQLLKHQVAEPRASGEIDAADLARLLGVKALTIRRKREFPYLFLKNSKWRSCPLQLAIPFGGARESISIRSREQQLLLDIHQLIFGFDFSERLVHDAVVKLLSELNLKYAFGDWVRDPLLMMRSCRHEKRMQQERDEQLKKLIAKA